MKYFLLVYPSQNSQPIIHKLELATYILGRHSSCTILVPDNQKYVSRWHCTLVLMPPDRDNETPYYFLKDGLLPGGSKSENGTWVNGNKIKNHQLTHQDIITFGEGREYPKAIFIDEFLQDIDDGTISNNTNTE